MKNKLHIIVCDSLVVARSLLDYTCGVCKDLIERVNRRLCSIDLKDGRHLVFITEHQFQTYPEKYSSHQLVADTRYELALARYEAERTATKRIATEIIAKFWDGLAGNVDEWIVDFIKSTAKEYNVEVK